MKKILGAIGVLAVLVILQIFFVNYFLLNGPIYQGPYIYEIIMLAGVNVILAVSLNLINGITGQFSIGHAGFYAIGAYTCAYVTYYWGPAIRDHIAFLPLLAQDGLILLLGLI